MPGKILWFAMLLITFFNYKVKAQVREYLICTNDTFIYPQVIDSAYYRIDFGDGDHDSGYYPIKHLYQKSGKYNLVVKKILKAGTVINQYVARVGSLPKPAFEAHSGCYLYQFTNQMPDTVMVNGGWLWEFGDGISSSGESPTHLYLNASGFKVQLEYARKNQCSSSISKMIYTSSGFYPGFDVHINKNEAIFLPLDTSENYYHWDFSNTDTSNALFPIHTFNKPGTYPVSLTIKTSAGCETFYTDTISVTSAGIQPLTVNSDLFAAYPNPFHNDMVIHYEIIGAKFVIMNIYDISGRLAASILNERQSSGRYDLHFNASNYGLKRGMYMLGAYFDQEYFSQKLIME